LPFEGRNGSGRGGHGAQEQTSMTIKSRLSAVLPIKLPSRSVEGDLQRAEMLFKTLRCFATEERIFEEIWIVAPGSDLPRIREALSEYACFDLRYADEDQLVPEFRKYPTVGGWTRQQVIKLAACRLMETPYYMTFDCDVLCTRRLELDDLLPNGKALIQLGSKLIHPTWWSSSAHLLGLEPKMNVPGMQVTPAVLSTEVCDLLIRELDRLGTPASAFEYLLKPLSRFAKQRLTPGYKKKFRWTEYTLYYLFAESRDLVAKYHTVCGTLEHPQLLISDHSLWAADEIKNWSPEKAFSSEDRGLFCVVQSNTDFPPSEVWLRVAKLLPHQAPNHS